MHKIWGGSSTCLLNNGQGENELVHSEMTLTLMTLIFPNFGGRKWSELAIEVEGLWDQNMMSEPGCPPPLWEQTSFVHAPL